MIAKTSILIYLIFPILGIIQNEEPCHSRGGNCMQASRCRDSESIRSGWCPSQSANVKCCLPYQESACSALGGQCKRTDSACSGNYVSGKCPSQPSNVRCCAPSGGGGGGSETDIFKYEPASRCTNAPQPGATCLLAYMQQNSPSGRSMGIYNCRNIAGSSKKSLHGEGRALDWGLNANNAAQKTEADGIINSFLANGASLARRMGIQEIIFNRRIWSALHSDSGLRPFSGEDPHTDHIHIGLNWKGARKETSFWQSFSC